MATYTSFFDFFPKIKYDMVNDPSKKRNYETVTNIFFRLGILKDVLNNTSSYYVYDVEGDDTPEIVAEKVYQDAGAGWIILFTNQIIDAQFEWVLDDKTFNRYIAEKYGSTAIAKTTAHHYEKVIERTVDNITTVTRFKIDGSRQSKNDLGVPYEVYNDAFPVTIDTTLYTVDSTSIRADDTAYLEEIVDMSAIEITKTYNTYNIDGQTVYEVYYYNAISNYNYESQLNDSRRAIKVIKSQYYPMIMDEFRTLIGNIPSYIRTVS